MESKTVELLTNKILSIENSLLNNNHKRAMEVIQQCKGITEVFFSVNNSDFSADTVQQIQTEEDVIKSALLMFEGKRDKTANYLRMSSRTLYRKIKKYKL